MTFFCNYSCFVLDRWKKIDAIVNKHSTDYKEKLKEMLDDLIDIAYYIDDSINSEN